MYRVKEDKGQLFGLYQPWLHEHEHGDELKFVHHGDEGDSMPKLHEEEEEDHDEDEEEE
jgi:hypothetical protein